MTRAEKYEKSKVEDLALFELLEVALTRIEKTNGLDFVPEKVLFDLLNYVEAELQDRGA